MIQDDQETVQPCPVTAAHRRLIDCHEIWHATEQGYMEPEAFRLNLNNLIQNLRNVTWLLQKQKANLPNFAQWYGAWRESVAQDSIMTWIVRSRNRIVKESDLELLSSASIWVSLDWANEFSIQWTMPPRYTTREILIRLMSTQDIPPIGILTIERRWIDRLLPKFELLEACAYAYENTAHIVATAHAETRTPRCDLPSRSIRCVSSRLASRLPCMHGWDENRRLHINLETRGEIAERLETIPRDTRARERYGETKLTGDAIELVPQIVEVNKRMLTLDGRLLAVAILMRGDRLIHSLGLEFSDQGSKRVAMHKVADWVERYNADGVVLVSEAWLAPMTPEENPADRRTPPASARPNRMEAISVAAITRDGRTADSICIFARLADGTFRFEDTIHNTDAQINSLEPVRRRWQAKSAT